MTIGIRSWHCGEVGLLVLLCAVVPGAWAEQTAADAGMRHRTIRESEAVAPWLLSSDQGLSILGAALESRHTDASADCSNLVHEIYARAGFGYSYANSSELYLGIKEFLRVMRPQAGDLVVWRGHVGIVISPLQHSFFSAMRSGRGVEFYDSPYWQQRGQPRFFRYIKPGSRLELSAAMRKANLKPESSRNAEAHEQVFADGKLSPAAGAFGAGGASGTSREKAAVSADDSNANPPAALPAAGASPQNSEGQATSEAHSAADEAKTRPTIHKIQSPEDGVWEKPAAKPSAGIPVESGVTERKPEEPGSQASNALRVPTGRVDARPHSANKPPVRQPRPQPTQWAMSRYVPRPPWSLPGTASRPRQFPRATVVPTWQ